MNHTNFIFIQTSNKTLGNLFCESEWDKFWFDDIFVALRSSKSIRKDGPKLFMSGEKLVLFDGRLDSTSPITYRGARFDANSLISDALVELWEEDAVNGLSGNFFMAIYDKNRQLFRGMTSPLTCPKIYFTTSKTGEFFLANDLSPIMKGIQDFPDFNEDYIIRYWALFGAHHSSHTPFKNINRLKSGSTIYRNKNTLYIQKYYNPCQTQAYPKLPAKDLEEEFRKLLFSSIEDSIDPGEKTFIDLSGGLDSSTLVCAAAELCKQGILSCDNIETISYTFSQSRSCDESIYSNEIVKFVPFKNWQYDFDLHPMYSEIPNKLYLEPGVQLSTPAQTHAMESFIPSLGGRALIKGVGGDEVISGYSGFPLHLSHYIRRGHFREWFREIINWYRQRREFSFRELLWKYSVSPIFNPSSCIVFADFFDLPDWLATSYVNEKLMPFIREWQTEVNKLWKQDTGIHSTIIANVENYRFPSSFVESRYPLLNRRLVEFMLQINRNQNITPKFDRLLQRKALRGVLPETVRTRIGKTFHDEYIFRGIRTGWSWIEEFFKNSHLVERGYVNEDLFRDRISQILHGKCHSDVRFVSLAINLEIWLKSMEKAKALQQF